ncbi:COG4223 family protein [Pararhodobacter oceanensis]|uniref:Inner membrane protein n=1 Tax=Pararhodobacter oceanensis TaxID=2172121 RepID=A0A2T8HQK9_9RHOB|nr:hypothetical protein [Pararhodobacter oceanensis]PVH27729.1 hypothetical protein DDE20_15580 [Pararhodobacter oceanensis]
MSDTDGNRGTRRPAQTAKSDAAKAEARGESTEVTNVFATDATADTSADTSPDADTVADTDAALDVPHDVTEDVTLQDGEPQEPPADDAADSAKAEATDTEADTTDTTQPPEAERAPVPAPLPAQAAKTAGAGNMIIGGVLAAGIGGLTALAVFPEGWRNASGDLQSRIAALEANTGGTPSADLTSLSDRLTALEAAPDLTDRVTALEQAETDLAPLEARIAALEEARLNNADLNAAIGSALAPVNTRIAQLEAGIPAQAQAAVDAALAESRAEVEAQAQALNARETDVEAAQERIAARAALAELIAAADSGEAAPGALATLNAATETPEALAPLADGLITAPGLRAAFAPAAREALNADAPPADAPVADRLLTFLRNQTGARSLAPRDGDSTDAILSRAEALVRQNEITAALGELEALPEAPAAAMAGWRAQAETRLAALDALAEMQTQLTRDED